MRTLCGHIYPPISQLILKNKKDKKELLITILYIPLLIPVPTSWVIWKYMKLSFESTYYMQMHVQVLYVAIARWKQQLLNPYFSHDSKWHCIEFPTMINCSWTVDYSINCIVNVSKSCDFNFSGIYLHVSLMLLFHVCIQKPKRQ